MPRSVRRPSLRAAPVAVAATVPVVLALLAMLAMLVGTLLPDGATAAPPSAAVAGVPVAGKVPGRAAAHRTRGVTVSVLSGRADLVSGGSALLAVGLPRRADRHRVVVTVGRRDVTGRFVPHGHAGLVGLVKGLHVGRDVVTATLPNGRGARLTLVDHPRGGPLFSGPQLTPWVCQAHARDRQCNQPSTFTYRYLSTSPVPGGLQPYDRRNPPSDVATTVAHGHRVPFIVRTETGYADRDQYSVSVLWQPGKRWTPTRPQPQFAHKMLIDHGSSCGTDRTTGTAPATTGRSTGAADTNDLALGQGFVVMSTALDNSGHNCNVAVQAESLVMAKEHVVKTLGTLRYTIGTGCSGGSLAQQQVANAYPGVYQGILPTCSFPDAYSTATQFLDYHLLLAYFTDPTRWNTAAGVVWSPTQMADVLGGPDGVANAEVSDQAQFHVAVPTDSCKGITDAQRYDPTTHPGGVRCTVQDAAINLFGPEQKRFWGPQEKKIGHGFARLPIDNVGVEYGLAQLRAGTITPAQFIDLNEKAGGVDIDANPVPQRVDDRDPSLGRAYRTGAIDEATHLDQVAIIDCRGPNPGLFHDAYRAFAIRQRLDDAHGTHANQVIWEGPVPLFGDAQCEPNSFTTMDRWLGAVSRDHRSGSLAAKIRRDKPTGVTDRCYDGTGQQLTSSLCPAAVVNVEGTPRTEAGDSIATDTNKCVLKPLVRSDYATLLVPFTDAQWKELTALYPQGVCDYSHRGVGQQPTVAWLTYQDAHGRVIYGGRPLGKPPTSTPLTRH